MSPRNVTNCEVCILGNNESEANTRDDTVTGAQSRRQIIHLDEQHWVCLGERRVGHHHFQRIRVILPDTQKVVCLLTPALRLCPQHPADIKQFDLNTIYLSMPQSSLIRKASMHLCTLLQGPRTNSEIDNSRLSIFLQDAIHRCHAPVMASNVDKEVYWWEYPIDDHVCGLHHFPFIGRGSCSRRSCSSVWSLARSGDSSPEIVMVMTSIRKCWWANSEILSWSKEDEQWWASWLLERNLSVVVLKTRQRRHMEEKGPEEVK